MPGFGPYSEPQGLKVVVLTPGPVRTGMPDQGLVHPAPSPGPGAKA
jgi:hypothetical protein